MRKTEISELNRLCAVRMNSNRFRHIWEKNVCLVETYREMDHIIGKVEQVIQLQALSSKHITAFKNSKEEALVKSLRHVNALLKMVADRTEDAGLRVLVKCSKTKLLEMRNNEQVAYGRMIEKEVRSHLPHLLLLGYTEERADAFTALVEDYRNWIGMPRHIIATRSAGTQSVPELLKQGRELIKDQLDGLMLDYEESEPEFYLEYRSARKRVKLATRKAKAGKAEAVAVEASRVQEVVEDDVVTLRLSAQSALVESHPVFGMLAGYAEEDTLGSWSLGTRNPFWEKERQVG